MRGEIIIFRLPKKTEQRVLNQFCKKFYGQETSSHKGKYRYRRRGFLDHVPHVKLIRGVIIVLEKDAEKVIEFLKKFNAEVHVRGVILTPGDEKALRGKG